MDERARGLRRRRRTAAPDRHRERYRLGVERLGERACEGVAGREAVRGVDRHGPPDHGGDGHGGTRPANAFASLSGVANAGGGSPVRHLRTTAPSEYWS